MELFAADGHDAGGCERVTGKSGMRPFPPRRRVKSRRQVLDEILDERVVSSRNRRTPRGVKRKMSNYPLRPRRVPTRTMDAKTAIEIVK